MKCEVILPRNEMKSEIANYNFYQTLSKQINKEAYEKSPRVIFYSYFMYNFSEQAFQETFCAWCSCFQGVSLDFFLAKIWLFPVLNFYTHDR